MSDDDPQGALDDAGDAERDRRIDDAMSDCCGVCNKVECYLCRPGLHGTGFNAVRHTRWCKAHAAFWRAK